MLQHRVVRLQLQIQPVQFGDTPKSFHRPPADRHIGNDLSCSFQGKQDPREQQLDDQDKRRNRHRFVAGTDHG